jgi:MSHA biogenesis protein MshI
MLLGWLRNKKKVPGWLALSVDSRGIEFAHGRYSAPRSHISFYGSRDFEAEKQDLAHVAQAVHLSRYDCAALLRPGDYQLLLVEAPSVPKEELKAAIRWRIKDMIDYHIDDATVDVLDIPQKDLAPAARNRLMYAVSAKNDLIESTIRQCEAAKIPLSVIDIRETAQRNIAALCEDGEGAVALIYFAEAEGLLTINFGKELYLARRLDVGLKQIAGDPALDEAAIERVAVEIQRTLDHFDRQFRSITVARLLIAPTPAPTGVAAHLNARLGIPADDIDLGQLLAFDGAQPEREAQWRLFHHFGAALRHETKAL